MAKKSEPRTKRVTKPVAPAAPAAPAAGADDAAEQAAAPAARPARTTRATSTKRARKAATPRKTDSAPSAASAEDPRDGAEGAEGEADERVDAGGGDEGEVIEAVGEVVEGDDVPLVEISDDDVFAAARRSAAEDDRTDRRAYALSRTDPLQAYLREVQRYPLLTPDEEKDLTVKYAQTGDVKIAARLVTANLRLVVKLAYEYRRAYKNIMDLIQEGNIGLMQAVKRYDPYRGVKLSSYAAWWIRAYILRFILNNWRLVKLGTTQAQRKLFFNLNKEKARLTAMGIDPSPKEIAKRLNVEEQEVIDMDGRMASSEASLDAPAGDAEGRTIARIELMPGPGVSPETAFQSMEVGHMLHERLAKFRETLAGKDMIIFDKRMAADEPLTLQELGNEFGVSRERVRQLEARLTERLREYLREELGDAVGAG